LVHFFRFWYHVPRKIWQPCPKLKCIQPARQPHSKDLFTRTAIFRVWRRRATKIESFLSVCRADMARHGATRFHCLCKQACNQMYVPKAKFWLRWSGPMLCTITNFGDCDDLSPNKIAIFLKTDFEYFRALFRANNGQYFCPFRTKYLQNHNIGPRSTLPRSVARF
jgi:hypothetical protein